MILNEPAAKGAVVKIFHRSTIDRFLDFFRRIAFFFAVLGQAGGSLLGLKDVRQPPGKRTRLP